jgi:8-oxo-dGTP pyrophosphatase MutT (NUDIX family)
MLITLGKTELQQLPFHATASVFVLRASGLGDEVLLVRHSKLHRWMIPGGHVEQGEEPWMAAEREVFEETGLHVQLISAGITADIGQIEDMYLVPSPAWVAIENIPNASGQPDHRHIDYLFIGRIESNLQPSEAAARWFDMGELPTSEMFFGTLRLLDYLRRDGLALLKTRCLLRDQR